MESEYCVVAVSMTSHFYLHAPIMILQQPDGSPMKLPMDIILALVKDRLHIKRSNGKQLIDPDHAGELNGYLYYD